MRTARRHDNTHLDFVRQLPCCICADNTATEAAHIRYADPRIAKPITGIGIKPDDRFTVPLCGRHNREQHESNERSWWRERRIDPVLVSLALFSISGDIEQAEKIIHAASFRI